MYISQNGQKNTNKIQENGKKWPKIANNCKISEITKYCEKMRKIDKNVKQCKKKNA